MRTDPLVDQATLLAAIAGDQRAIDDVVSGCLPLVYNIAGRALSGHADVDDVVQETMLRVVRGLARIADPASFRSWVVAVTMSQIRQRSRTVLLEVERRNGGFGRAAHWRADRAGTGPVGTGDLDDVADPGADFVDLTILRLALSGQRREVVEATRWLEPDAREVLSLWWLEAAGQLTRAEVADALDVGPEHAAVTIQRMKARLETARAVVRALRYTPRCPDLAALCDRWDGHPSALWRKRLAKHVRDCRRCGQQPAGLVDAERLLAGMVFVPVPASLAARSAGTAGTAGTAATTGGAGTAGTAGTAATAGVPAGFAGGFGPLVAAVSTVAVLAVAGVAAAVFNGASQGPPKRGSTAAAGPPQASTAGSPSASESVSASPSGGTSASQPGAAATGGTKSAKKGVSVWYFDGVASALSDVRANWCYTWAADHGKITTPAGVEFVPMIWGADSVTSANLAKAKNQGRVLLGFNEPDMSGQANMTVARALELWPQLVSTGMRLGSPSVAYGADTPGGWLDQFMSGARTRGHRVDFITLHWYGSDFSAAATGQLRNYLQATYNRYHLPIWLTEYALIKFSNGTSFPTQAQQASFATASTAMLEGLSYVERYAWFALPVSKTGDTGLYSSATTPTTVGAAYRAAGSKG